MLICAACNLFASPSITCGVFAHFKSTLLKIETRTNDGNRRESENVFLIHTRIKQRIRRRHGSFRNIRHTGSSTG
jgi:hypothetical protein